MRTTIDLDADTAKAVQRLREKGRGLSEAVNELIRQGLLGRSATPARFVQRSRPLGIRIDVSNVAEALDVLEGPRAR